MIEGSGSRAGSGSGSIPVTNGSGSRRPKNMWIRIRIRNTAEQDPEQIRKSVVRIRIRTKKSRTHKTGGTHGTVPEDEFWQEWEGRDSSGQWRRRAWRAGRTAACPTSPIRWSWSEQRWHTKKTINCGLRYTGTKLALVYKNASLFISATSARIRSYENSELRIPDPVPFWPLDPGSQTHTFESLITIFGLKVPQSFVNWPKVFSLPVQK
jgi:hypothetical protein